MSSEIDRILEEWKTRIDAKTENIIFHLDQSLKKAAFYCEGEAKKNVASQVYSTPGETYQRTGLLQGSIFSGMHPDIEHTAIIYSTVPYAKYVEFGTGKAGSESDIYRPFDGGYSLNWKGMRARPFMYPAVFQNKQQIKDIIAKYLREQAKLDGR
jgi:HK97 gp10 family phage protein